MAYQKKTQSSIEVSTSDHSEDFSAELIKQLNKESGEQIAFNLGTEDAPTIVKRWISTGSKQLDYIISNKSNGGLPEGRIIELQGPASCHAKGDKVLLSTGASINVEDIKVGDKLMGPDGKPRKVLRLVRGKDQLYKITQKRSNYSYTVNSKHKLALMNKQDKNQITKISVEEYLKKSDWWKENNSWFHVSVDQFENSIKNLPIDSYILGLLLGDGSLKENRIELTTADDVLKKEYVSFINKNGFKSKLHYKKDNKAYGIYHITDIKSNQFLYQQPDANTIRNNLRNLKLLNTVSGNKFIPDIYKFASLEDRKQILAGLLDTDGYLHNNCFDYVSKSKQLAKDVQFVANSIGLVVSFNTKFVNGVEYYRLCISGDVDTVPTKLLRKMAHKNKKKNSLMFGITVEKDVYGDFYGFTVDKDNLYLGEDFSVIKNSGKSHIAIAVARSTQQMGGIVVYIDTENATSLENLKLLGVDVKTRFVFVQNSCTEEIFKVAEAAIMKARAMTKDVPVTIIWDSVAASAPQAELTGEYTDNTIGLQARVLGKGLRKIANIIANQKVLFLLINQQRMKIGCVGPDTVVQYRNV